MRIEDSNASLIYRMGRKRDPLMAGGGYVLNSRSGETGVLKRRSGEDGGYAPVSRLQNHSF